MIGCVWQCPAKAIVDITRIPGQVAASPLIRSRVGVLAEACGSVGGPQIRNVGTLVGNVVNALPAADEAIALFALDAEAEVAERAACRSTPIAALYAGVGLCTLDPCAAMITQLRFRALGKGEAGAFERLAKRRALVLPILNTATIVRLQGDKVDGARIAIGPVAKTPFVAAEAAEALVGRPPDGASVTEAAELAAQAAQPRDSLLRGSAEYRKAVVKVLVRRALWRAVETASLQEGEDANS